MMKLQVNGIVCNENGGAMRPLEVLISNDTYGKTLSINDGKTQFTIPFESIEKHMKGGGEG